MVNKNSMKRGLGILHFFSPKAIWFSFFENGPSTLVLAKYVANFWQNVNIYKKLCNGNILLDWRNSKYAT